MEKEENGTRIGGTSRRRHDDSRPPWHGLYEETSEKESEGQTRGNRRETAKWPLKYGAGVSTIGTILVLLGWLGAQQEIGGLVALGMTLPGIPLGAWIVNGVKGRGWKTTEGLRRMLDLGGRAFVANAVLVGYFLAGALPVVGVIALIGAVLY